MSGIPGPFVLIGLPLAMAVAVYLVRRWALIASLLSALTTAGLGVLCLRLPLDRPALVMGQAISFGQSVSILGRELGIDDASRIWLAFAFLSASMLFLFAWRISQGWTFFPTGLALTSLYSGVILLQHQTLAALTFAMAATLVVFVVQSGVHGPVRGALRYLVVTVLGVPLFLLAGWLIDQSTLRPENASLARQAVIPLAFGLGLWLAVVPFHTWLTALAADAPPLVTAFVACVGQGLVIWLGLDFLRDNPAAVEPWPVYPALQVAGLTMALIGGAFAAVQRDFGRLFGYALLANLGVLLLALGDGSSRGLTTALLHLAHRTGSAVLMAAGLAVLRHRAATDSFAGVSGLARRLPLTTVGLLGGGLGLAGFPLTAGFPTHWAVLRMVAGTQWPWVLALLASSAGIVVGLLRGLSALLGPETDRDIAPQPVIAAGLIALLLILNVAAALQPQLFLAPAEQVVQTLNLF